MDLTAWGGPERRKALVLLGAGASYGAQLGDGPFRARPPLDLGFFGELQKLAPTPGIEGLLSFVREEFGPNLRLSMEEFFSQAEYTDRFHRELKIDPGPQIKKYSKALERFYEILPRLFSEAIGDRTCSLHGELASRLFVEDVILSFNYDCLIDAALRDRASKRWDPDQRGYGFSVKEGGKWWKKHSGKKGAPFKSSITLLKPHGSFNWKRNSKGDVSLEKAPYAIQTARDRIIPPTWFKRLTDKPFAEVWKRARSEIRACRVLVVVGYSVPVTDLFSRALFKAEVGSKEHRQALEFLVLVNPDPLARNRFADLVRGGLEAKTRILEFDSLEEFIRSLGTES